MQFNGQYFDGITSIGHEAQLSLVGHTVTVTWTGGRQSFDAGDLSVEAPLGSLPRKVRWGTSAHFVSDDQAALSQLAEVNGSKKSASWISRLEASFTSVAVAAVCCMALLALAAIYGVPAATSSIAEQLPTSVSRQMAATTLANLDQIFSPSKLETSRQQQLEKYFAAHGGDDVEVFFRREERFVGANALTLSGTTVVFTDAIVNLLEKDEQLLAVFLHELGHARLRHVEQTLLQSVGWAVLLTFITGDVGGVGELLLTLPLTAGQAAYSRQFEREADAFAVAELQRHGLNPEALAQALEELERSHNGEPEGADDESLTDKSLRVQRSILEFLASHPVTAERIAAIRESQQ